MNNLSCIRPKIHGGGGRIIFWEPFNNDGSVPHVEIPQSLNGERHKRMLERHLNVPHFISKEKLFQQDIAHIHKTHCVSREMVPGFGLVPSIAAFKSDQKFLVCILTLRWSFIAWKSCQRKTWVVKFNFFGDSFWRSFFGFLWNRCHDKLHQLSPVVVWCPLNFYCERSWCLIHRSILIKVIDWKIVLSVNVCINFGQECMCTNGYFMSVFKESLISNVYPFEFGDF